MNKPMDIILKRVKDLKLEDEFQQLMKSNEIEIVRGEVFLIDKSKKDVFDSLLNKFYLRLIYLGKKIGRIANEFYPNVAFFEELFQYAKEEKIINVPYKKAWLFCCGRDLFIRLKSGGHYFFISYNNRFIGFGKLNTKKKYIENLFDIGIYIRNQSKI